jgi:hypothetical protein
LGWKHFRFHRASMLWIQKRRIKFPVNLPILDLIIEHLTIYEVEKLTLFARRFSQLVDIKL